MIRTYKVEWMGSLVEVIYNEVHPYGLRSGNNRELIRIPTTPWQDNQGHGWVLLRFPCGLVEISSRDVMVPGHKLDLGVDDMHLLCAGRQSLKNRRRRRDMLNVDVVSDGWQRGV